MRICKRQISIGSASSEHLMSVVGSTKFNMILVIDNKEVSFYVSSLVIRDLSDNLNLGSQFLCKHEVVLRFYNEKPLILQFKEHSRLIYICSMTQNHDKSESTKTDVETRSSLQNSAARSEIVFSEETTGSSKIAHQENTRSLHGQTRPEKAVKLYFGAADTPYMGNKIKAECLLPAISKYLGVGGNDNEPTFKTAKTKHQVMFI